MDDDIRKKAAGFRVTPRADVWPAIARELDGRKKRRRAAGWWWLPLLLAGGGAGIYLAASNHQTSAEAPTPQQAVNHTAPATVYEAPAVADTTAATSFVMPHQKLAHTQPPHAAVSGGPVPTPAPAGAGLLEPRARLTLPLTAAPVAGHTTTPAAHDRLAEMPPIYPTDSSTQTTGATQNMAATGQAPLVADTTEIANAAAEIPAKPVPDTPSLLGAMGPGSAAGAVKNDSAAPQIPAAKPVSKVEWHAMAGTGLSNLGARGIGIGAGALAFNTDQQGSGTGTSAGVAAMEPSKPGWGFSAGLQRSQSLGKQQRWWWTTGLLYQLQTMRQYTGSRFDTSVAAFPGNTIRSGGMYRPGNTQTHTGYQHRVYLSTGLALAIGRRQHWYWQNSVYGGVVISASYLVPAPGFAGWVHAGTGFSSGFAGAETRLRFQPGSLGASLAAQYTFTRAMRTTNFLPQYWRGAELSIYWRLTALTPKK